MEAVIVDIVGRRRLGRAGITQGTAPTGPRRPVVEPLGEVAMAGGASVDEDLLALLHAPAARGQAAHWA